MLLFIIFLIKKSILISQMIFPRKIIWRFHVLIETPKLMYFLNQNVLNAFILKKR